MLKNLFLFICLTLYITSVNADDSNNADTNPLFIDNSLDSQAQKRLNRWAALGDVVRERADTGFTLKTVNRFFNKLRFVSDERQWGREDYWATPYEFLVSNAGDCEDFAIAKYVTLVKLGVPVEQLRLIHVNSRQLKQAHMVLGYIASEGAEPLILDNLTSRVLPLSRRQDLEPVYSFNDAGLWLGADGARVGDASRVSLWQAVSLRMGVDEI